MRFDEWEPIYSEILEDMGYDRETDESSARLLKAVMMNSDLISDDEINIEDTVTVFGDSNGLEDDINEHGSKGTLIASGSSVERLLRIGIVPDIIVTDLDGDIGSQIEAGNSGAITFIHAHGDNAELIQEYAFRFKGPVVLTTQSTPDSVLSNYGGFTDGDRAVCIAEHLGAKRIILLGFNFDEPREKIGSDPSIKRKKLQWAKRIIFDHFQDSIIQFYG